MTAILSSHRRLIVLALTFALLVAAMILAARGVHAGHSLSMIIGDPHHCKGGSPGPGCGNGS